MYWYTKNWILKFISKEKLNLPFYIEEEVVSFEKTKIEIMNELVEWDYFWYFDIIIYKSNWIVAWHWFNKFIEKMFWLYWWEIIIDNDWWFHFEWGTTSEYYKWESIKKINDKFQTSIKQFTAWYSQVEIDSWKTKEEEATNVINWIPSTFIDELLITGESSIDLANKIKANAILFRTAYANAEQTKRQALKNLI